MGRHPFQKDDLFQEERFFYATAVTGRWQLTGRVSTFWNFSSSQNFWESIFPEGLSWHLPGRFIFMQHPPVRLPARILAKFKRSFHFERRLASGKGLPRSALRSLDRARGRNGRKAFSTYRARLYINNSSSSDPWVAMMTFIINNLRYVYKFIQSFNLLKKNTVSLEERQARVGRGKGSCLAASMLRKVMPAWQCS